MSPSAWRAFSPDARRFLLGAILLELGHAFLWVLQNLYVRSVGFGDAAAGQVLASAGLGVVLSTIPAATPRQPAWIARPARPSREANNSGMQSAVLIATAGSPADSFQPSASVSWGASPPTIRLPWTWTRVRGANSRKQALAGAT